MDFIFIIELAIVAVIVIIQFVTFFKNNSAIRKLGKIFPESKNLQTKKVAIPAEEKNGEKSTANHEINLIVDHTQFSPTFRGIIKTINLYLARQKGNPSEDTIKELAETKVTSHEKAIESNIAMPLYIGLLCTFVGVIIGLVRIATDGVSDYAIQSFIGGVLIGMIGSANGLALTVRSNFMFKEGKKTRDKGQYDFFNFLRTHFVPEGIAQSTFAKEEAKENLEIFHEGFVKYQKHMNLSLNETLKLFSDLKGVFAQVSNMEMGLKGINQYLHSNENIIEKQVASIEHFSKRAELISKKLNDYYAKVDKQLASLVSENIKAIDRKTQLAYSSMHNGHSNGSNGYHNGGSLAYAEAIDMDLTQIREKIKGIEQESLELNKQLLQEVNETNQSNQKTSSQMSLLNNQLAKILEHQETNYFKSKEFRFFIWTGVTAFLAGISGAIIYAINIFL